ncbi:hypothetical protein ILYODFUR_010485 [Ilyodon furcidens]|uniref:Uncharacterized protein n=2 Tax=Goodeidae TaxID=28758 RepID=A0ABV0VCX1_9TELE
MRSRLVSHHRCHGSSLALSQAGGHIPASQQRSNPTDGKSCYSQSSPRMAPGTRPPHFYNALHLHKVLHWDKQGLCKPMTSKEKKQLWASSRSLTAQSILMPGREGQTKSLFT